MPTAILPPRDLSCCCTPSLPLIWRWCSRLYFHRQFFGAAPSLPYLLPATSRCCCCCCYRWVHAATPHDIKYPLPQEHAHPPCFRSSPSENSDDGGAASLPAAPAVGCVCFPPEYPCALLLRLIFVPGSSWRVRPCSNIIPHEASSEPIFPKVFVNPRRFAQTAV